MASNDNLSGRDDNRVELHVPRGESESVIQVTLRTLAVMRNVPISDLEPLYERIEPDALVDLLSHAEECNAAVSVEFTVEGHTVAISHEEGEHLGDSNPVVVEVVDDA
ncbi:HalOD1 output domain-containing protein [Halopelagius longus]|uniref:Halobacterial output domain-containing protein n=1 Tax=Halopelagius longus TaxID=1236180 RepID=A0A1H1EF61_9EURY|nr:HalOD1 output domain-containing protein [Halopelagius longus]RDI71731.1 hypothetical protein DWB78_08330 [Halopelagius longus]SDQ87367.1 hypothetical protein SAMN05216278_2878 [Halopelagius longus]